VSRKRRHDFPAGSFGSSKAFGSQCAWAMTRIVSSFAAGRICIATERDSGVQSGFPGRAPCQATAGRASSSKKLRRRSDACALRKRIRRCVKRKSSALRETSDRFVHLADIVFGVKRKTLVGQRSTLRRVFGVQPAFALLLLNDFAQKPIEIAHALIEIAQHEHRLLPYGRAAHNLVLRHPGRHGDAVEYRVQAAEVIRDMVPVSDHLQ